MSETGVTSIDVTAPVPQPVRIDVTVPGPQGPPGTPGGPQGPAGPPGPPGAAYTLPVATTATLGGVKPDGVTILVTGTGVISSTGGSGGGLPEAPLDGFAYGRQLASWNRVLAATDDVVDGGNFITRDGF